MSTLACVAARSFGNLSAIKTPNAMTPARVVCYLELPLASFSTSFHGLRTSPLRCLERVISVLEVHPVFEVSTTFEDQGLEIESAPEPEGAPRCQPLSHSAVYV